MRRSCGVGGALICHGVHTALVGDNPCHGDCNCRNRESLDWCGVTRTKLVELDNVGLTCFANPILYAIAMLHNIANAAMIKRFLRRNCLELFHWFVRG